MRAGEYRFYVPLETEPVDAFDVDPRVRELDGLSQSALKARFEDREPELTWALTRRYGLEEGGQPMAKLTSLLRDLLAQYPDDRPQEGGEVFDRLEDLWELHRPGKGRTALREWVESRNALDAELDAAGEKAEDATTDPKLRRAVSETVILSRGTVAEDDEESGKLDTLSLSAVEPVEPALYVDQPPPTDENSPDEEGRKWWKW